MTGHTSEPLGLVVRFTLKPGAESEFDSLIAETVRQIARHEPGTLVYACHTDDEARPSTRVFYELYADRAAFERHEEQPHVQHFLTERERFVDDTQVTFLRLDVATGINTAAG